MTRKERYIRLPIIVFLLLCSINPVDSFAAKKKPNKKKASASSNKGFGAAPPTVEEVAAKFKTRLPENAGSLPCPCGVSGALYSNCCQPYHLGTKSVETPLRVLQTRYSAFCYRLVPFIIQTTHPTCRDYKENKVTWAKDLNREGMFDSTEFVELIPGETQGDDEKATLEFQVRMRSKDGEKSETVVSEKSVFLRDAKGLWSYSTGEVRSQAAGLEDAILNP